MVIMVISSFPNCVWEYIDQFNKQLNSHLSIISYIHSQIQFGNEGMMKKASSLVEAPNIDKKPDEKKLKRQLSKAQDTKERNVCILNAYVQGYSQHMIAKVLGLNQATVQRIIKRTKSDSISIT